MYKYKDPYQLDFRHVQTYGEVHKIIIFNQKGKQCCFQQLHIIESIHSSEAEQSESDSKFYHLLAMGLYKLLNFSKPQSHL